MALGMVRDKKTGRKRKVDPVKSRAAKKGARKRGHKKESATTRRKIAKGVSRSNRTGKTASGRRVVKRKAAGRGMSGKTHSEATRKKMSRAHKRRWKEHGARYRKAHKSRSRGRKRG